MDPWDELLDFVRVDWRPTGEVSASVIVYCFSVVCFSGCGSITLTQFMYNRHIVTYKVHRSLLPGLHS